MSLTIRQRFFASRHMLVALAALQKTTTDFLAKLKVVYYHRVWFMFDWWGDGTCDLYGFQDYRSSRLYCSLFCSHRFPLPATPMNARCAPFRRKLRSIFAKGISKLFLVIGSAAATAIALRRTADQTPGVKTDG